MDIIGNKSTFSAAQIFIPPPSGGWGVWGDNCRVWSLVDRDDLSIKQELMPAGTSEALHYHNLANQFFFILNGIATFEIENNVITLGIHQGIEIKAGQQHKISNHSTGDLEFILYSQPSTKNDRINC